MKLLYLTSLTAVPTEEGQKRIDKALKKEKDGVGEPTYLSKQWYQEQGLKPPKDLEDDTDEISEEGFMHLPLEEIEYEDSDLVFALEEFVACQENELIGSHLYTKGGEIFHIMETPEQLFSYIAVITRKWDEKVIDWIKLKIKWKKK